eukprot:6476135-Amphidinium_carterae.1
MQFLIVAAVPFSTYIVHHTHSPTTYTTTDTTIDSTNVHNHHNNHNTNYNKSSQDLCQTGECTAHLHNASSQPFNRSQKEYVAEKDVIQPPLHRPVLSPQELVYSVPMQCTKKYLDNILPVCTTTTGSRQNGTVFTIKCETDQPIPMECLFLSIQQSTQAELHSEEPQPWLAQLCAFSGMLQLIFTLCTCRRRTSVPELKQPKSQRGPLEPFGAPRFRRPATPQQPTAPLRHLLPSSPVVLTGGAPPVGRGTHLESTLYSSPPALSPHCLYASVLYIADLEIHMDHVQCLRTAVRRILEVAASQDRLIAGHKLDYWSQATRMTSHNYLKATNTFPYRKGNTCDAYLLSRVLGMSVWVFDSTGAPHMLSHSSRPQAAIQHEDNHFRVIECPVLQQEPREYFNQRMSELPLRLMEEPRINSMLSRLRHNNKQAKNECPLAEQFFHTHMGSASTHMRLGLVTPQFNPCVLSTSLEEPSMVLFMDGVIQIRPVPIWTAVTRIIVELEFNHTDCGKILDALRFMDDIIHNRVEALIDWLLEPQPLEAQQAQQACTDILEKSMVQFPQIFAKFVGKFPFRVQHGRKVYAEITRICRMESGMAKPRYIVLETSTAQELRQIPDSVLRLRSEEVQPVRAAIARRFGDDLQPLDKADIIMRTPEKTTRQMTLSPTLPFVDDPIETASSARSAGQDTTERPHQRRRTSPMVQGAGPKQSSGSGLCPKAPARAVSYRPVHEGEYEERHTPSRSSGSQGNEQVSSPEDDSFESLFMPARVEGQAAEYPHVAYVSRDIPFHVHMLSGSPSS